MADEIRVVAGREYKVIRHYRKRNGKLQFVGEQHVRVDKGPKIGRRKRLRLQREAQGNGEQ